MLLQYVLFYFDKFVLVISNTDLLGMFNACPPVCGRRNCAEVVMSLMIGLCKERAWYNWLSVNCICTGDIQGYRIEGSKEAYIRYDSGIVFCMAVAVR